MLVMIGGYTAALKAGAGVITVGFTFGSLLTIAMIILSINRLGWLRAKSQPH
jgi:hypothetical protein